MSFIFISYARADKARAKVLADYLSQRGLEVWWDHELEPGALFSVELRQRIDAAAYVIVLWSAHSVASHYVLDEAGHARTLGKLVPVRIEDCEIPLGFGQLHVHEVRDWPEDLAPVLAKVGVPPDDEGRPPRQRRGVVGRMLSAVGIALLIAVGGLGGVYMANPEVLPLVQLADWARQRGREAAEPAPDPAEVARREAEERKRALESEREGEQRKALLEDCRSPGYADRSILGCSELITRNVDREEAYFYRGMAEIRRGDTTKATFDLEQVIRLAPQTANAFVARARIAFGRADYLAAVEAASKALEIEKGHAYAHYYRALGYASQRNYRPALEDYDEAIRLSPRFAIAYNNRGSLHRAMGDQDRAMADFEEAIRLDGRLVLALVNRAELHYGRRAYDRAIADYSAAIKVNPRYASAYSGRGNAHFARRSWELAISDFSEALRLDPQRGADYGNRGRALAERREWDRALEDLAKAQTLGIAVQPHLAAIYLGRGIARSQARDTDRAIADLSTSLQLNANQWMAYYERARAYASRQDHARALADLGQVVRLQPTSSAYYNRGQQHMALKDYASAVSDFTEAIRIEPGRADTYHARGRALVLDNKLDSGLRDLNDAVRLAPADPAVYANRGVTHERKGDKARAIADYQRVLQLEPTNSFARDGLRRLGIR